MITDNINSILPANVSSFGSLHSVSLIYDGYCCCCYDYNYYLYRPDLMVREVVTGNIIPSQTIVYTAPYTTMNLYFWADIPPLGYNTYSLELNPNGTSSSSSASSSSSYLSKPQHIKLAKSSKDKDNNSNGNNNKIHIEEIATEMNDFNIENDILNVVFDGSTGYMKKVTTYSFHLWIDLSLICY